MKKIAAADAKANFAKLLSMSREEDVVITRRGKPVGVLVGFKSDDDWFDYQLEHDPRFITRIRKSRASAKAGRVVTIEDLEAALAEEEVGGAGIGEGSMTRSG